MAFIVIAKFSSLLVFKPISETTARSSVGFVILPSTGNNFWPAVTMK